MKTSKLLGILLATQTIALLVYTYYAFNNQGASLLQIFFSNIASMTWNGQFNLDFLCYLMLSGLWMMWRNKFSLNSIIIGIVAMVLGIVVFAPYVIILLIREKGEIKRVLIGDR